MRNFWIVVCGFIVSFPLSAAEKPTAKSRAETLAPFLESTTFGIVRLDLARIDPQAIDKTFKNYLGDGRLGQQKVGAKLAGLKQIWKKLQIEEAYIILSLANFLDQEVPRLVLVTPDAATAKKINKDVEEIPLFREFQFLPKGKVLIGGDKLSLKRLDEEKPSSQPELAKALAVSNAPVQVLLYTSGNLFRRSIEENAAQLPPELGGGSVKVLTRGLKWGVLSIEGPPNLKLNLTLQSANAKSAQALSKFCAKALKLISAELSHGKQLPEEVSQLFKKLQPSVKGNQLTLALVENDFQSPIKLMISKAQNTASRVMAMNNMKQIGVAMHNYYSDHGVLPAPYTMDKKKKPLLSWRVHILPYIEQSELYKQFKLDEPWDSPNNKKLLKLIPRIFAPLDNQQLAAKGMTTLVVPVHQKSMFPGDKGIQFNDVSDGTSNTIMVTEVDPEHAVPWTKPADWKVDLKNPKAKLRVYDTGGFLTGMADGSVRFLKSTIKNATLGKLIMRNDGMPIDDNE